MIRVGTFYFSYAPGEGRQRIALPNGGCVYVRVAESEHRDIEERALETALDFADPLPDESVMNTHPLPASKAGRS